MRLLTAYISREMTLSFVAVLGVLLLVIMGGEVARLLTEALEGRLSPDLVLQLVLLKIPMAMEILLPLSVLLAVMLTFGRLYHDREMEVLAASGIAPRYFVRLVMLLALIAALMAGFFSLFGAAWSMQQERNILAEGQLRTHIKSLVGGRFTPLPSSQGVFYAETVSAKGELTDIFIQLRTPEKLDQLLLAPRGYFEQQQGRTQLILLNGQVMSGLLGPEELMSQRFERMTVWLPDWQVTLSALDIEAMDTLTLWQKRDEPRAMAHLQWRFFVIASVLVLAFVGWRLARVGPRKGRYSRMALGLGFYLLFMQVAIALRSQIQSGGLPVFPGMLMMLVFPLLVVMPIVHWWWLLKRRLIGK